MTETTDQLEWTIPTPGDKQETGEWGEILNSAIDDGIEPDVAEALAGARRVYDVTTYGAVGDGNTDDSGAIQDATDAAASAGGGVVYYPDTSASYHLESGVMPKSETYHIGPQPYGTHITASGLARREAIYGNRTTPHDIGFYGLFIDATDAWGSQDYHFNQRPIAITPTPQTTNGGNGRNITIEYCYTLNSPATGIGVDSMINSRYCRNIIENAGTGNDQGGNGIGIGVGQVDGPCPTWIVDNHIINTGQFGIILEQTGGELTCEGYHIHNNTVAGGMSGIGVELVQGFEVSNNVVITRKGMEHGIIVDHLDSREDPSFGSVTGNSVIGDTTIDKQAGLIGDGAAFVNASDNIVESSAGDGFTIGGASTRCTINGYGTEGAGAGNDPSDDWSQHGPGTIVRNSDDDTFWLRYSGEWIKIADLQDKGTESNQGGTFSRVSLTSSQSVLPDEFTTIQFDTIQADSLGAVNSDSNDVTIPDDGTYHITNSIRAADVPRGARIIARIDAGGSELARLDSHASVTGGSALGSRVSDVRELSEGDVVTGMVYQDSDSLLDLRSVSAETFLAVSRVE